MGKLWPCSTVFLLNPIEAPLDIRYYTISGTTRLKFRPREGADSVTRLGFVVERIFIWQVESFVAQNLGLCLCSVSSFYRSHDDKNTGRC